MLSDECISDEVPFEELPEGWAWARLGSIVRDTEAGKSPRCENRSRENNEWGVIKTTAIQEGRFLASENKVLPSSFTPNKTITVHNGDLLITRAGPKNRTGVLCVVGDEPKNLILSDKTVRLCYLTGYLDPAFLMLSLNSPLGQRQVTNSASGMAASQVNISQEKMKGYLIPIPPLAEQRRIVERISELMPLVEEYGKLEEAREALDAALPNRLRKSVLQMAVRGKLVPQDPADEPADALLERIREQRRQMMAEKKMKAPKGGESVIYTGSDGRRYEKRIDAKGRESEPACIEDEIPFDIPDTWAWARLESLITLLSGTDLKPAQYNDKREGIPYLTGASNFNSGRLVENRWTVEPSRISHKGELLFTCKGTVGEMALNSFAEAHIARQIMAISPADIETLPYLTVFLRSAVEAVKSKAKGVIPGIERKTLLGALVPVPPLGEQRRITSTINSVTPYFTNQ